MVAKNSAYCFLRGRARTLRVEVTWLPYRDDEHVAILRRRIPNCVRPLRLGVFLRDLTNFGSRRVVRMDSERVGLSHRVTKYKRLTTLRSSKYSVFRGRAFRIFRGDLILVLANGGLAFVVPNTVVRRGFCVPKGGGATVDVGKVVRLVLCVQRTAHRFLYLAPQGVRHFFLTVVRGNVVFGVVLR